MSETNLQNYITHDSHDSVKEHFLLINDLIEEGKTEEARKELLELHYADLADYLSNSNFFHQQEILSLLGRDFNPETLVWLEDSVKNSIAKILGNSQLAKLIEKLDIEDAIEVIEDLAEDTKDQVLAKLTKSKLKLIQEGLTYPENSAGRAMSKNFLSFTQEMTVGQVIDSLRTKKSLPREFHAAIVVDSLGRPVGTVSMSNIIISSRNVKLKNIMNTEFKIADTMTDEEELSYVFKHYALSIVPVTNKKGKLVGTISIEDIVYVIDEQAQEDFMHLGGVAEYDRFNTYWVTAKQRFPWLFVNLVMACMTSIIISFFEATISQMAILSAVMTIVASLGGNAGSQTVTVAVRSIASKDINDSNAWRIIFKELMVAILNGAIIASVGGVILFAIYSNYYISLVFGGAVLFNIIIAGLFGSFIPIALEKLDIDPAIASGVLVTTLTDSLGFFIFLALAYLFIIQ